MIIKIKCLCNFGDGGGGVLIEQTDDYGIDSILKTDGSGNQFLTVPAGGSRKPASETTVKQRLHYVYQDGNGLNMQLIG